MRPSKQRGFGFEAALRTGGFGSGLESITLEARSPQTGVALPICSFDAALKPEGLDMAVKSCGLAAALKKIVWKQP